MGIEKIPNSVNTAESIKRKTKRERLDLELDKSLKTDAELILKYLEALEYQKTPMTEALVGHGNIGVIDRYYEDLEKLIEKMRGTIQKLAPKYPEPGPEW
jgi:hypothetical protein